MKALAKKLTNKAVIAHVAAYSSRPILHVRDAGKPESSSRAYTFIDSMTQFGGAIVREDLDDAYRRAGTAFRGQMEQHFVVLKEGHNPPGKTSGHRPPPATRKGKRSREDGEEAGTSNESKAKKK